ncbi:MAG: sensor domain-containing diguanylate cyclase, partial [Bacillota bacterium]
MVNNLIFNLKQKLNTLQDKLKEEKKFIASILDTQPSLVVVLDTEGRIIRFNKACENITGYTIEEVQGKLIWEILLVEGEQQEIKNIFEKIKNNSSTTQNYKNHWKAKNGKLHFISWSNTVITDKNDQIKYIIATGIDITENKEQQEKINYMNFHDSLTDLYNREYLEKKLQQLDTTKEMPISIIMGDANGLKLINDTYGHIIGDQMLIEIADLLKDSCRENDIISRWGGDEFIILLPQTELEEAQTICRRINNSCSNHSIKKIPLSIALGAATKKDESDDIYDILKKSEERMYKNKLIQSEDRKRNILKSLLFTLKNQTDESKRHIKNVEKISLAL